MGIKLGYVNFKFIDPLFKDDEEVVKAAINDDARALKYASKRLRNDKNIAIMALKKDSRAMKYVGKDVRNDIDVIRLFNETKKKEKELKKRD